MLINFSNTNKFIYLILSLSLFIGLKYNEDFGGGGSINDFYNTFPKVLEPINNLYNFDNKLPLHYFIGFVINNFFENQLNFRFFYIFIAIILPIIFYNCLKIKYDKINKDYLFLLSLILLVLPGVRSAAIWPNTQLSALFFFLLSIYFLLKWEKNKNNNHLNLFLFFMALTVYCRELYAIIYLYFVFFLFKNLDFKEFLKKILYIFLLSIPGFIFLLLSPTKSMTAIDLFSFNLQNSILINFSIIFFYLLPFFLINYKTWIKHFDVKLIILSLIFLLIIYFLSLYFNFSLRNGGGVFLKLSVIFFKNNYFFYFSSFAGILTCYLITQKKILNILLISLIVFGISGHYIFMKYFEPMFIILFFLIIKNTEIEDFISKKKQVIIYFNYFVIYFMGSMIFTLFKLKNYLFIN